MSLLRSSWSVRVSDADMHPLSLTRRTFWVIIVGHRLYNLSDGPVLSGYVGFLAPDKIDSKFFDPKHAFKEVEVQAKTVKELIPVKKPKVCVCVSTCAHGYNK